MGLDDHIDIHVVEEGEVAAEDESDDEAEDSMAKVSINGVEWSVNKPERRSTINVFNSLAAEEQGSATPGAAGGAQGGELTIAQAPSAAGAGQRAIARKRSSMSAVDL